MKTAFRAKIIFETEKKPPKGFKQYSLTKIYEVIRNNDFDIELVDDFLTNDLEPVIIIKEK